MSRPDKEGGAMEVNARLSEQAKLPVIQESDKRVPARATIVRRVLAWVIDYLIVMVPGMTLVLLAVASLIHTLPAYLGAVGGEVGWSHLVHLIANTGTEAHGVKAVASDEWVSFVYPLIGALLAVPLLQFAYQAAMLSWRGRTVGKIVTDTRVDAARANTLLRRRRFAARRATSTTVVET